MPSGQLHLEGCLLPFDDGEGFPDDESRVARQDDPMNPYGCGTKDVAFEVGGRCREAEEDKDGISLTAAEPAAQIHDSSTLICAFTVEVALGNTFSATLIFEAGADLALCNRPGSRSWILPLVSSSTVVTAITCYPTISPCRVRLDYAFFHSVDDEVDLT